MSAVESAINLETGITAEPDTSGGTSDGRFVAVMGTEVVELGHLNATIHQTNERVRVEDIDTLSAIFERVLERLLGETH